MNVLHALSVVPEGQQRTLSKRGSSGGMFVRVGVQGKENQGRSVDGTGRGIPGWVEALGFTVA